MLAQILSEVEKKVIGKNKILRQMVLALLCNGHVLIEDVPGVGKTTIAKSVAEVLDLSFSRIQFTPDLMPSDVLGYSIYNRNSGAMEFKKGPLHSHLVLADEINRTSPKTQSSLLEAMAERQVTIDGKTYPLEAPFMVIATQNPIEFEGTFPLPEAQLDRFLMKLSIGYPETLEDELRIVTTTFKTVAIKPQIDRMEILKYRKEVNAVYMDDSISQYIVQLIRKTRDHPQILLGVSPRGSIALHHVAKAEAYMNDRDYVIPEDVTQHLFEIIGHRLILKSDASYKGVTHEGIVQDILETIAFPKKSSTSG